MKHIYLSLLTIFSYIVLDAQESPNYEFKNIVDIDATTVKDQGKTGTCWSFSTSSFLESEILRINGKHVDISEMYFARMVYPQKALNYVSRHGKAQFGEGGLNHDAMKIVAEYGIIPEENYKAKIVDNEKYNHSELATVLDAYVKAIIKNKGKHISPVWLDGFNAILDVYLGEVPEDFIFYEKRYTPSSFRDDMGIDVDNYVEITSFEGHKYNSKFILNIPDNWSNASYYNLNLDDYYNLVINALKKGYSVTFDADVSEKTFSAKEGIAIIPATDFENMSEDEKSKLFKEPIKEKKITPKLRQEEFYNYKTTDDHLMHITGIAKDKAGTLFFKVKNSWGTDRWKNDGYIYVSEAFFKLKSIAVMMHKDAIPSNIKRKLDIK